MPTPRGRLSYQGDPEGAGINLAKRTAAYAGEVQRENTKAAKNNAMMALGKNVPASALPAGGIHTNMSQADQDAAARAVQAYNGTTPPAAHMPGPTHMPANTPQMGGAAAPAGRAVAVAPTFDKDGNLKEAPANPGATSTAQTGLNGAFRGSTADEVKEFYANKPGSIDSPASKATIANAGAGNTVQTPFGTASSTNAKNGPGATWQEQVVANHPEIGMKGSPENKAFLSAYSNAKEAGGAIDPHAIADQVYSNRGVVGGPSQDVPEAQKPLVFQGPPASLMNPNIPAMAGKALHDAPGAIANAVTGAVGGAINKVGGAARDFIAGVTGNPNAGATPPVIPGGTQSPKQIADASARAGLQAQTANTASATPPVTPSAAAPATAGSYAGTTPPAPAPSSGAPVPSPIQKGIDAIYPYTGNRDTPSPIQQGLNFIRPYAGQQDTRNNAQPEGYAGAGKVDQNGNVPQTASSDPHADIHAATVNAITTAGQNAHNAVNSSSSSTQPYTGSASPSSTPAPTTGDSQKTKQSTADF